MSREARSPAPVGRNLPSPEEIIANITAIEHFLPRRDLAELYKSSTIRDWKLESFVFMDMTNLKD